MLIFYTHGHLTNVALCEPWILLLTVFLIDLYQFLISLSSFDIWPLNNSKLIVRI